MRIEGKGMRRIAATLVTTAALTGCMDAGDVGMGPACRTALKMAEDALSRAKARNIGGAVAWARAASLIAAAKTQQQFDEYQNCTIKAREASRVLARYE